MKHHSTMARFVPAEPPTIEAPGTATVPPAPATVYMVVLSAAAIVAALMGVTLSLVSDWSKVLITLCAGGMLVGLVALFIVILSGSLPSLLWYWAHNNHDRRAYRIELTKLRNESARISVPQLMDPARAAAVQWLRLMYTDHGPNYNEVRPSGQLINTAPWSSRSANQRDGLAMLRILEDAGLVSTDGQNPVLNIQDCPTLDIALANLS